MVIQINAEKIISFKTKNSQKTGCRGGTQQRAPIKNLQLTSCLTSPKKLDHSHTAGEDENRHSPSAKEGGGFLRN